MTSSEHITFLVYYDVCNVSVSVS